MMNEKSENEMPWLNVDFDPREYSCRLHRNDCRFILRVPTPYKGIGELKRDGGWLFFKTVKEAKKWHDNNYPQIPWKPCEVCKPEAERTKNEV